MTIILNGTTGVTFPNGVTMSDGTSAPVTVAQGGTGATSLAAATIATQGYTTTATAAGTTTLTVASTQLQFFTGATTQTVVLPVASTLTAGQRFEIHNNSTGSITVNSSGANLVSTVLTNTTVVCTCILTSGTSAASWDADVQGITTVLPAALGGTGATTLTANNVILGNGTSAVQFVAPSTSGNVLTSNGTTWQSTTPASSAPTTAQVLSATAGATPGAVGTYGFFSTNGVSMPQNQNANISGSSMRYASTVTNNLSAPSGTWKLMGYLENGSEGSVFVRIS